MTLPRPPNNPPPPSPPLIAPTGSPGVNCVVDVINQTAAPFRSAPPPEQGAAGAVAQYVGGAMAVIGAPAQIIDTAFAALTAPLAALFPSMPAVTLLGMHVGIPHTHTHPPSFIPPAPPIPLPSIGVLLASGSVAVLVGGLPAARAGDIGISVTCGSLAPPFEVFTGSSNVFIAGQRAARVLDITKHCNPTSLGVFGAIMGAAGVAAGAAAAAGSAAAGTTGAAIAQGAQAAADAAAMALKVLCGKDPGLPPGMGALVGPPVPNVLIGGFPCPPVGDLAVGGLMKLLKSLARAAKSKFSSRRGNACRGNGGEPIYLVTGENFNTFTDFVSPGLFEWKRHYTSARNRHDSALGFCNRHHYERELRVRLHKAVFTDWDGVEIGFPRFEQGETTTRSNGYLLERLAPGRHLVLYRGQPSMEFRGGEFDVTLRLTRLFDDHRELRLGYDDLGRLVTFADWDERTQRTTRYELHYDRDDRITELIELPPTGSSIVLVAYGYDNAGDLIGVENAIGGRWQYGYDYRHCLTRQTDPNSYTYTWKYDTSGRCVWSEGEDGLWWTEITYFPEKKLTRFKEGDHAEWELFYDDDGFITKIIDPYGGVMKRQRDEEGKIVLETDSGGREFRWLYNGDGSHYARQDQFGYLYPPEAEMPKLPNPLQRELPRTPLARVFAGLLTASKYAAQGVASLRGGGRDRTQPAPRHPPGGAAGAGGPGLPSAPTRRELCGARDPRATRRPGPPCDRGRQPRPEAHMAL
jgi:YD repeat-containing protein